MWRSDQRFERNKQAGGGAYISVTSKIKGLQYESDVPCSIAFVQPKRSVRMEITCLSKIRFVICDREINNPMLSFLKCFVNFALPPTSHYNMAARIKPARKTPVSIPPPGQITLFWFLSRPIILQEIV